MKGCSSSWLTLERELGPATDHSWCASIPTTHGFGVTSATAVGPILNLPEPSGVEVAVGRLRSGPTPQISPSEFAGEKKMAWFMSPRPKWEPPNGTLLHGSASGRS